MADPTFSALYEQSLDDLRADLNESGAAQTVLEKWAALLTTDAGDLVSGDVVADEAAAIATHFTDEGA